MSDNSELIEELSERELQIMEAALKVFSEKGFNGATTKEIAEVAGVAEGTIFRYFKTKKDLLFSLTAPNMLNLLQPIIFNSVLKIMQNNESLNDEELLKNILKNRLELLRKHLPLLKVILTESQYHPEMKKQFVENVPLKGLEIFTEYFSKKIARGRYKNLDPQIVFICLAGMFGAFMVWENLFEGSNYLQFSEDEMINTITEIFLHGIMK
jgi:AcrR family transcriptional regulator